MPTNFYFLMSSLPMLRFGEKSPISHEQFIEACEGNCSEGILEELRRLSINITGEETFAHCLAPANRWLSHEIALRNAIAAQRAVRLQRPMPPEMPTSFSDDSLAKDVENAFAAPSPEERETKLDELRWNALDEMENGHDFDCDALVVYSLKLQLLERKQSRKVQAGITEYARLVDAGVLQAAEVRC